MLLAGRIFAAVLLFALLTSGLAVAQLPGLKAASEMGAQAMNAKDVPEPQDVKLVDRPGDDGTGLVVTFKLDAGEAVYVMPQVEVDGHWARAAKAPIALDSIPKVSELPEVFGNWPGNPDERVIVIDSFFPPAANAPVATAKTGTEPGTTESEPNAQTENVNEQAGAPAAAAEEAQSEPLVPKHSYHVQLTITNATGTRNVDAGTQTARENLFAPSKLNILLISLIFAAIILGAIYKARTNPGNLFIRRIAGLEAVEEAIGRATEMGKPVMQINGLDPLTTPSTIAAVNLLGQIARKVAHYDSRLMVPSFDPVVMTVAQETVKQAYLVEGRPDAFREDDLFFVTDQQFSYVASVCGLMLREKPAANFFLGYFYAEALLLAETGQSTGAIQIAGTDAQAQLPFFITTCDTLIGEELYAASAYLSREPILLGGLKGLDVAKVIIMALVLFGTIFATFGIEFLTELFTPLG
jgi:hypothetical protein